MARFFVTVWGVQRPDPLTDPFEQVDSCRHAVVYIETRCCHMGAPKRPPSGSFPVPSLNGHQVAPTQLLPTVRPGDGEGPEAARHRKDGEDEGGDGMRDFVLGGLVGAALAIIVIGLLLILLLR